MEHTEQGARKMITEMKKILGKDSFKNFYETVILIGVLQSVKRVGRIDPEEIGRDLHREKQGVMSIDEFVEIAREKIPELVAENLLFHNGQLTPTGEILTEEYQKLLNEK